MDVMGDSEARTALASANGEYLRLLADDTATTDAMARAYEQTVNAGHAVRAEDALALERACSAAEAVLAQAAARLAREPNVAPDAVSAIVAGYLALAEFRQAAADAPTTARALNHKLRRIDS